MSDVGLISEAKEWIAERASYGLDVDPIVSRLLSALEESRGELGWIDSILARRPALDDLTTRAEKIERASAVAGRADAAEREQGRLRAALEERERCVRTALRATMTEMNEWQTEIERLRKAYEPPFVAILSWSIPAARRALEPKEEARG